MENLQGGTLALEHRYDVQDHEGRSGLVTRYRAEQSPFQKDVAICVWDVLEEGESDSGEMVSLIKERAEVAARISVPGLLRAIDYGEIDVNAPFVVTEFGSGPRLSEHLTRVSTLSPAETITLVSRLAEILEGVHDLGAVHGGLGAHVIRLPGKRLTHASIGELGLNLRMSEARSLENVILDYEFVSPLPPEAFGADAVEPTKAFDVYALGAIAYTCIAGVHPFFDDMNDISEGLVQVRRGETSALTDYGADESVSLAIAKALSLEPDDRFVSVSEFVQALNPAAEEVQSEPEESEEVSEVEESLELQAVQVTEPSPRSTTLGLVAFVLVMSNLAWFFYLGQETNAVSAPPVSVEGGVLSKGVEIATEPAGAQVSKLDATGEVALGETPLVIDPDIDESGRVQVRVQQAGFEPLELEVSETELGRRVQFKLSAVE